MLNDRCDTHLRLFPVHLSVKARSRPRGAYRNRSARRRGRTCRRCTIRQVKDCNSPKGIRAFCDLRGDKNAFTLKKEISLDTSRLSYIVSHRHPRRRGNRRRRTLYHIPRLSGIFPDCIGSLKPDIFPLCRILCPPLSHYEKEALTTDNFCRFFFRKSRMFTRRNSQNCDFRRFCTCFFRRIAHFYGISLTFS